MLHGPNLSGNFSYFYLFCCCWWYSAQAFLILVRYGHPRRNSTRFSSSLFCHSSFHLICPTICFILFHSLSIPVSSFLAYLLLFLSPSLTSSVSFTLSPLSCIVIGGSPLISKTKTLNSSEAPCVPTATPLRASTVLQSSCHLFCFSVVKPPNGRPCKDSLHAGLVFPENHPLISHLVVGVIQVADTLGTGQRKRCGAWPFWLWIYLFMYLLAFVSNLAPSLPTLSGFPTSGASQF